MDTVGSRAIPKGEMMGVDACIFAKNAKKCVFIDRRKNFFGYSYEDQNILLAVAKKE